VKQLLNRLRRTRHDDPLTVGGETISPSILGPEAEPQLPVSWPSRSGEINARPLPRDEGEYLFAQLWAADHGAIGSGDNSVARLANFIDFVQVDARRDIIAQDEQGDFLLIVLRGNLSVERRRPGGTLIRLAEARPGDLLGEMAVLDAGTRFSACRTITPCALAVLLAKSLDEMIEQEPKLAARLMVSIARRLSLRLRQTSARLSALL
jgi:CRP-like cAMP-binding protein